MAAGPHTFATYDVFTAERYQGNPLAIVSVRGNNLTQAQKQLIAREFNYSETVFLHDGEGRGKPRRLDIFLVDQEIPFAGHPVIGTAHFIFNTIEKLVLPNGFSGDQANQTQSTVLLTKAGPITVNYNPYRQVAAAEIPHDIHIHSKRVPASAIVAAHPQLKAVKEESAKLAEKSFPVVSIVKGMSFILVDLTGFPESMAALKAGPTPEMELDEEWSPSFHAAMYYDLHPPSSPSSSSSSSFTASSHQPPSSPSKISTPPIHHLRARMIEGMIEDPATGAGCCALASYLALQLGDGGAKEAHHVFAIEQGVEMGRRSQICVEVRVSAGEQKPREEKEETKGKEVKVKEVVLSGKACFVMKGELAQVF